MGYWIISADEKVYDHRLAFQTWGYVDWGVRVNMSIGDIVYIYFRTPISKIRYRTEVVKTNIKFDEITENEDFWLQGNQRSINSKFVRLKLIGTVDDDNLSYAKLKQYGVKSTLQAAYNIKNSELVKYIEASFKHFLADNNGKEIETIENEVDNLKIEATERDALIKCRVNQSKYRSELLKRYKRCCLCKVSNRELLIASHIKPWSQCESTEKLDIDNGLLLCPNHDKLFDLGFISFDDDGKILICDGLKEIDRTFMNVEDKMSIVINEGNKKYLEYHRKKVFKNHNG